MSKFFGYSAVNTLDLKCFEISKSFEPYNVWERILEGSKYGKYLVIAMGVERRI